MYTWGSNKRGVLGYESSEEKVSPEEVVSLRKLNVVEIAAGLDFNVVRTKVNYDYSLGIY